MLEVIPECSTNPREFPSPPAYSNDFAGKKLLCQRSLSQPIVLFITIQSSRLALWFYSLVVGGILVGFSLILGRWLWLSVSHQLFMVSCVICSVTMGFSFARHIKRFVAKAIRVQRFIVYKDYWMLQRGTSGAEVQVKLAGEILSWSVLAIIPVQEILTKKEINLIIWRDALNREDWRKLKVWIKHTFKPVN